MIEVSVCNRTSHVARCAFAHLLVGTATGITVALLLAGCASAPAPTTRRAVPPPPMPPGLIHRQTTARAASSFVPAAARRAAAAVVSGATVSAVPVECAFHGPAYVTTNFIPYEVRFLAADYRLLAGKTYQFETSENLNTWNSVVQPYFAPADEVYTRSINISVNGYFYPRQFARMRVIQ